MEPSCVRQDLLPGTSRLFSDYLYHFERVECFYPHGGWEAERVTAAAAHLTYPDERRTRLVKALAEQNAQSAALERLAQPGTVAVVTGQQVGLFSGPAYTIFKALTAVKLAAHLEQQGVAAVPVFWLASEDHDLAEVDHAWIFNQDAVPAKITVSNTAVNNGPVGDVRLGEVPLEALRSSLGDLPFADEVMAKVALAYGEGATLGSAFRSLLQDILRDFGLIFLDPLAPAIRELGAPFLAMTVDRVPELVGGLQARNAELTAAGYHAQVHVDDDASLLFLLSEGRRTALRYKEGRFKSRDQWFEAHELKEMGVRLSPNALLRPVMQDYLLPTVAYVAGPSETAYFAQGSVLYQNLLGRMPVIYPRNSFTLLDARATKLMDRNGLRLQDVLDHEEKVKAHIAGRLVPKGLAEKFSTVHATVSQALTGLQADLQHFDPTLEAAARKSNAKVLYQLDRMKQKTARETLRRDDKAGRDAAYLMNLVYPQKHLQERLYSIVPFLAKYGMDLPQRLYEEIQLSCPDHMVRTI